MRQGEGGRAGGVIVYCNKRRAFSPCSCTLMTSLSQLLIVTLLKLMVKGKGLGGYNDILRVPATRSNSGKVLQQQHRPRLTSYQQFVVVVVVVVVY